VVTKATTKNISLKVIELSRMVVCKDFSKDMQLLRHPEKRLKSTCCFAECKNSVLVETTFFGEKVAKNN
jgi:hypothetical protein